MAGRAVTKAFLLLSFSACAIGASHGVRHAHPRARGVERRAADPQSDPSIEIRDAAAHDAPADRPLQKDSLPGFMPDGGSSYQEVRNRLLKREYADKLAMRDKLAQQLSHGMPRLRPRQIVSYSAVDLQQENNELQEGLDDLSAAFDSLFNILAQNYPVCLGTNVTNTDADPDPTTTIEKTMYTTRSEYVTNTAGTTGPITSSSITPSIDGTYATTYPPYPTASNGTALNGTGFSASSSATPTASIIPTNSNTTNSTSNTTSSGFSPMSSSNVAVYYGQANIQVSLTTICNDPSVDIVVLAFITTLDNGNGYPTLNLGNSGCYAASSAQTAAGATGLIDCTAVVAPEIQTCQNNGKPVMISFGGAEGYSETTIANATAATTYASTLWKLFGEGTGLESIRPFGNVTLDGFDIDNEYPDDDNYPTFISSLRTYLSTASKPMYLSAAPQCPRPSESIPLTSLQSSLDFIFVQFYNNPSCNINAGQGFLDSVAAWSSDIASTSAGGGAFDNIGNGVTSPRLFIGAPAWSGASADAYTSAADLAPILADVRALGLGNLGGGMLWNGEYGEENVDSNGNSFVSVFKVDLQGTT